MLVVLVVLAVGATQTEVTAPLRLPFEQPSSLRSSVAPSAQANVHPPVTRTGSPDIRPPAGPSAHPSSRPPVTPIARDPFQPLARAVGALVAASGARVGVALTELGGPAPGTWSVNADEEFAAASLYKLPLLMDEARLVSQGRASGTDTICYQESDQEDGWFQDYTDGACYTRAELEERVGRYSDNTAAHMLVRVDGGSDALNAYAASLGARESAFYDPNVTTAIDLDRLWQAETEGRAGGQPAQAYLYPLLTDTAFESGIPAGTSPGAQVVHKIGELDGVVNDAALVTNGPHGAYVLAVCTDGLGGDPGWQLVAGISEAVWSYESMR
jgi:beta-lactamase class A